MIKQKLHKRVALSLLLIFAFPLIYQPAHYFFIHHDNYANTHHKTEQIAKHHEHIACSIDHFQLTEIVSHNFNENTYKQYFNVLINIVYKLTFIKNIVSHTFLLRAPPC